VAESLLRLVDEARPARHRHLVRQDENTAGGLMTTNYAWLPPDLTASEALEPARLQAPKSETITTSSSSTRSTGCWEFCRCAT